jgi:hypothetical protein
LVNFDILFELTIIKTKLKITYKIAAIDCSAYGLYMIDIPIAIA